MEMPFFRELKEPKIKKINKNKNKILFLKIIIVE
tara:strand:- start:79 stop:180 length:102 start_codon:yes stop_codon:yes gene_type:complete